MWKMKVNSLTKILAPFELSRALNDPISIYHQENFEFEVESHEKYIN